MIYLSITLSESTIYALIQLIQQSVNNLDDNFDGNTSEKDETYALCDN